MLFVTFSLTVLLSVTEKQTRLIQEHKNIMFFHGRGYDRALCFKIKSIEKRRIRLVGDEITLRTECVWKSVAPDFYIS